jgi:molybdopterin-guanine dinucleotide biosynthesis protein A
MQPGPEAARCGLLLLTGGDGRRMGGPKHDRPHPDGGTWGGHLLAVFQAVFPEGPVAILGESLPDHPEHPAHPDPRLGPAVALSSWSGLEPMAEARRWWLVACDQVRWTSAELAAWHARAEAADPAAGNWVLARHGDRTQFLGGFLPGSLRAALAGQRATSLWGLARVLPTLVLDTRGEPWLDVDTPEDLRSWLGPAGGGS